MARTAFRDRVVELRRVKASDLLPNPRNWRRHPPRQVAALRGLLKEIGFAGAALAVETKDGLMLVDGHLRQELAGDIVLDLFAGSGSTTIAAERAERRCYAMELDPRYCDVVVARWEAFAGGKARRG
jgi:hypothetical protein